MDQLNYDMEEAERYEQHLEEQIEDLSCIIDALQKKEKILYSLARLARNTDGLHPSTQGPAMGKLLLELRLLDGAEYALKVM